MHLQRSAASRVLGYLSVIAALVWAFIRVGSQTSVSITSDANRAWSWPDPGLNSLEAYTRTSPVGSIAYKALHVHTEQAYFWLHAIAAIVAILLLAYWCSSTVSNEKVTFVAARVSILGPVTASVSI